MSERKQFTIDYGGSTETFLATQAEYDQKIADYRAQQIKRQNRNQFTMYEAAEVLATSNEIGDAKHFLIRRMRPAVESGLLRVTDPLDGGPIDRRHRLYSDWVTPDDINKWLEGEGYPYRWPAPAQDTAPLESVVAGGATHAPAAVAALVESDKTRPKFSMTKTAMMEQHAHEWPTLKRDMADASTNGLAAAKAGPRGWYEPDAMEWARANNKLANTSKSASSLTQAMNSMGNLPGRKHTLEG